MLRRMGTIVAGFCIMCVSSLEEMIKIGKMSKTEIQQASMDVMLIKFENFLINLSFHSVRLLSEGKSSKAIKMKHF